MLDLRCDGPGWCHVCDNVDRPSVPTAEYACKTCHKPRTYYQSRSSDECYDCEDEQMAANLAAMIDNHPGPPIPWSER